jgi:hypothetical protein
MTEPEENYMVLYIGVERGDIAGVYQNQTLPPSPIQPMEKGIDPDFATGKRPHDISTKSYSTLYAAFSPG